MKKTIADLWIANLRSGKYEQGLRALHRDGKFCCLGVLCDLADPRGWYTRPGARFKSWRVPYGETGVLPREVSAWAGLQSVSPNHRGIDLTQLNDNGYTFSYIADFIEKNWQHL